MNEHLFSAIGLILTTGNGAMVEALWLGRILCAGAVALILLGLYGIMTRYHLIRVLLGIGLLDNGVNLFLVTVGFRPEAAAPILTGEAGGAGLSTMAMVDPLPQALVLTSIVIGVGVLALGLALAVRVRAAHGTLDTRILARRLIPDGGGDDTKPRSSLSVSDLSVSGEASPRPGEASP